MILSAEQLSVSLAGKPIINDVSLLLARGTFTAIVGPNGAGKTTLVRALAGLLPLANGVARLGSTSVHALHPRERARTIGYLAQGGKPEWAVTVRALVELGRAPWQQGFTASKADDDGAVESALSALSLSDFADRTVDTLSGGEMARVLLARVLAGEPRWILADEPLTHLDLAYQLSILQALRRSAASGVGVLTIVHDLTLASRFADRLILLHEGRVIADGPPRIVLTEANIAAAFGIDATLLEHDGQLTIVPRLDMAGSPR